MTGSPFNREKFLLILLSSIFAYQASIFAFGVWSCTRVTPKTAIKQVCPELGQRFDQTFSVMIATTLALLTSSAAVNLTQRKQSSEDAVTRVTAADRVTRVTQDAPTKKPRDSGPKTF